MMQYIHQYQVLMDVDLAEAGEFTKIAFQNGKINLLKAESISDLLASETEIQRKSYKNNVWQKFR